MQSLVPFAEFHFAVLPFGYTGMRGVAKSLGSGCWVGPLEVGGVSTWAVLISGSSCCVSPAKRQILSQKLLQCSARNVEKLSAVDSLAGMSGMLQFGGWWMSFLFVSFPHMKMEYLPLEKIP